MSVSEASDNRRKELDIQLQETRQAVQEAARQAGRSPQDVTLVAVSKTKPAEDVAALFDAGQTVFGENYVQEAVAKQDDLARLGIRWHFIGGLQSNKAKFVAGRFDLVHSVDSLKLARKLQDRAQAAGGVQDILLQVNVGCEEQKCGVLADGLFELAEAVEEFEGVRVCGLMTMPPFFDQPERVRPLFAELRKLKEKLEIRLDRSLPHLSMGMTGDFVPAIMEGATLVRIGTRIFGERNYKR